MVKVKVKFSLTSHGDSEGGEDGMLGFHPYFDIRQK
jgi:hypothetical protein